MDTVSESEADAKDGKKKTKDSPKGTRGSLGSNSVPNTSFVGNQTTVNNNWILEVDMPATVKPDEQRAASASTIVQEVKGQPGNPDLADEANKKFKIPTQPTMTSLQGDDRSPRVDVLWKVHSGLNPESLASVSNCHLEFSQNKRETRIIPRFTKPDLEDNPSRTPSEPNGNLRIVEKKSEDEEGGLGHRRDYHGGSRRGNEPLKRRETWNWPWHSGNYEVTYHFQNPTFRTQFSSKILLMKTIQWLIITVWTLGAKDIPGFEVSSNALFWSVYGVWLVYIVTYLMARSLNVVEVNWVSYITMSIYVGFFIDISHATATMYIFYDNPLIPATVLILILAHVVVIIYCTFLEKDVQEATIYFPMSMSIFVFSIPAFWIIMFIRDEGVEQVSRYIGTVWCPSLIIAEIVASTEMSEIHSLISGTRLPLGPEDWPVAATFLY